jgi:hypothetical protein
MYYYLIPLFEVGILFNQTFDKLFTEKALRRYICVCAVHNHITAETVCILD